MIDYTQFNTLFQFLPLAKRNMSTDAWDYMIGGSETETTLHRNRQALDSIAFRPRVLRDVEHVDTRTTLLGQRLDMPVVLAPIGSLQDIWAQSGIAPTLAAAKAGIVHMLSSVCIPGPAEVAAATEHPKFFQLYVRGDPFWVDDVIAEALACGYQGICLTVDRAHYGRRERNLAKSFSPTAHAGDASELFQARFTWADVERIRANLPVPLILKGIATAEDAELAIDVGVDCIYVSNHGGRQLDHALGSIQVLPEIASAVGGRAEIIVDGGVMRGTDIVKALALGARAVGIGRLQCIGLGAGGEAALVRMLEILRAEMSTCMALLGLNRTSEIGPEALRKTEASDRNWLDSAFPLLKEGYGEH